MDTNGKTKKQIAIELYEKIRELYEETSEKYELPLGGCYYSDMMDLIDEHIQDIEESWR